MRFLPLFSCSEEITLDKFARNLGANRVVIALSIARMADALGNSIILVSLPLFVAQLPSPILSSIPESRVIGILISLYGIVFSALQPLTGAVSDRMSRRKPFITWGLVVMGFGTLAYVIAARAIDIVFMRLAQGIGVALTVPAALALMAISSEKDTRGGSMGVYTGFRMVGFALGPLLGGYLQITYGFNAVFIAGSAFLFLAVLLVQVLVHEDATDVTEARSKPLRLFDPGVFTLSLIALAVGMFLMASAYSMITTLEPQFNARLQQTALGFGIAFSALTFTRLIFQVPLGRLSDRIGRKPPIIVGLIIMAPATALLGLAATTLQLAGLTALQGLASAAIAAPGFALAGDLSHAGGEGQQMGLMAMGFGFGIAVGPLIAGAVAIYSFELPFLIGGLLCLVGAWIVYRLVPETIFRGQSQTRPSHHVSSAE
jgi:MFS family permease